MSPASTPIAVLFASLGLNPTEDVVTDRVDLIEVNHFFDDHGRHVFDQIIFYDWSPNAGRYNVRAWRPLKTPAQIPQRDWRTREFVAVWHDGTMLRRVQAATVRESWTQYDPELVERSFLPKEQRPELRKTIRESTAAR